MRPNPPPYHHPHPLHPRLKQEEYSESIIRKSLLGTQGLGSVIMCSVALGYKVSKHGA